MLGPHQHLLEFVWYHSLFLVLLPSPWSTSPALPRCPASPQAHVLSTGHMEKTRASSTSLKGLCQNSEDSDHLHGWNLEFDCSFSGIRTLGSWEGASKLWESGMKRQIHCVQILESMHVFIHNVLWRPHQSLHLEQMRIFFPPQDQTHNEDT